MSLSDIMGHMDLSVYPQIGLVIFLAVFGLVVARLMGRASAAKSREHALIPLADEPVRSISRTETHESREMSR